MANAVSYMLAVIGSSFSQENTIINSDTPKHTVLSAFTLTEIFLPFFQLSLQDYAMYQK